jgi:hypothetical protein
VGTWIWGRRHEEKSVFPLIINGVLFLCGRSTHSMVLTAGLAGFYRPLQEVGFLAPGSDAWGSNEG